MTEIRQIADFNNGLDQYQFKTEIAANENIAKTCFDVSKTGDTIKITFSDVLSDEERTILNQLITDHVAVPAPEPSEAFVEANTSVIKHKIGNNIVTFLGSRGNEVIISKCSQSSYNSIKAGIDANPNPNTIYAIYPGTYSEVTPIVLPAGSVLIGRGSAQNTIIQVENPNNDIIHLGCGAAVLNVTLQNSNGPGARAIYFDGTQSGGLCVYAAVMYTFIKNCTIAIEIDGKNSESVVDPLFIDKLLVRPTTQTLDKAVYCHSGGQVISTSFAVYGVPGSFPVTYGIYASGQGTKVSMTTSSVWHCTTGLYLNDNAVGEIVLMTLTGNTNSVVVGPNGTVTRLGGTSIDIRESVTYDLDIQPLDAKVDFSSGLLDDKKFRNPNYIKLNIRFNKTKFGKYYQCMTGEFQFGTVLEPTKLSIGEGRYASDGIVVLSNTNMEIGTWADNSLEAETFELPAFNLFPGTGVGNCCYIGSDANIPGFKINIVTATNQVTPMENVVWEYWDGASWVRFNIMQTSADYPYHIYMNSFVSLEQKFHIRFGLNSATPFALKTLNGNNKKWIRMRVVTILPSVPTVAYIKIHVNSQVINQDGFTEYFGDSRIVKSIYTGLENIYAANCDPGDQELFVSKNISAKFTGNVFADNALIRLGFKALLPRDMDISFPIKIEIAFVVNSSAAGNIQWNVRYAATKTGESIYTNLDDAPDNANDFILVDTITPVAADKQNKDLREKILININKINVNPADGETCILWLTLERDARNSNNSDTYTGDVNLILIRCTHISCYTGNHLLGF